MTDKVDQLVPDRLARAELGGLTAMTFWRRDSQPEADWQQLEAYKAKLMAAALKRR
jgi:hypothetical protein